MATTRKQQLSSLMHLAWQFVKRNGFSMAEAMKQAWLNFKLHTAMQKGIVKFYFQKVSGELREAYGTLKEALMAETKGTGRKSNDTLQTYFDTEKQEYRCFKRANLVKIG